MSVLIKGGRVITAADDYVADIFIEGERISLIGESLDLAADKVIDASGQVRPAGRRRPAHPSRDAVARRDDDRRLRVGPYRCRVRRHDDARRLLHPGQGADVRRRTRGLACEARGQGADRQRVPHRGHRPARGRHARGARTPAGGARRHVLQALHGLQGLADGRRRDAVQDDAGCGRDRRARDGARRERRRDRGADDRGGRRRQHLAELPRADPAARARRRGDEPRHPARARRRLAALRRPRLVQGVGRADRARTRQGLERLGRDVHAVLLHRPVVPRPARLRGREVRLHAAASPEGEPGHPLERGAHRRAAGDLDRPLRLSLQGPEGRGARRLPPDPERRPRASRTGCR